MESRYEQHQNGEDSNHTKKYLPVVLVYHEVFTRIDKAFYRKKKEALINNQHYKLPKLSKNYT
jgi:putative endonuclease